MAAKWTEEEKQKALAIARSTSVREAVKATGIPLATIGRWLSEQKRNGTNGTEQAEQNGTPKKLEALYDQAVQRAVEQASEHIIERLKNLADQLYALAAKATSKVDVAISDQEEAPPGKHPEPHDRDGAAWVKALVGVMAQAIEKAQLLSGKPTARPEAVNKYEYDITQRIIADPEALDLAESLLRRAAGRDAGPLRLHGERGPLDAV